MKIKMLKKTQGSPDGIQVNVYEAGMEYDLPDRLANTFVNQMKVAEFVKQETKMMTGEDGTLEEQSFDSEKPANKRKK
jgi:hypothetical protein